MITRVALFISLLALFYNYCKDGESGTNYPQQNEINLQKLPAEYEQTQDYDSVSAAWFIGDSSEIFTSLNLSATDIVPHYYFASH